MRVDLRPASPSDAAFLARVHDSTREELTAVGLPPDVLAVVLRQQHDAQERAYRARFARLVRFVVAADDVEVGRLYLAVAADDVRVVDVAVLPAHRGRGIGTAALRRVIDLAGERPVHVTVRRDNRAVRLYAQLGFVETGRTATDLAMTAVPSGDGQARDRVGDAAAVEPPQPNDTT